MLSLQHSTVAEIRKFGQDLRLKYHERFDNMEDLAQVICQDIYHNFRISNDRSAFALFRIFRLGQHDDLPWAWRELADPAVDTMLMLMGTAGIEAAWNDRLQSQSHKVIPIDDNLSPMFKAAFEQTALDPRLSTELEALAVDTFTNYFHVEVVSDNDAVPDQEQFVKPYNIASMVGFGSRFLSGAAYLAVGFSVQPVSPEAVRRFSEMTIFVSTLLSAYDGRGTLWNE